MKERLTETVPGSGNGHGGDGVPQGELAPRSYLDRHGVRELMTPGVVMLAEDASLKQAFNAMAVHGVHAVLVVASSGGRPLGWVTGRGLLAKLERDPDLSQVGDAISERPVSIDPGASAREALRALSDSGVSHLLVCRTEGSSPEGVVSDLDLIWLAGAS